MSDLSNRLRWCRQARWLPIPLQILVALMPCAIGAQEPASIGPTERARIDSVFVDEDKPKVPGCALGVFIDDRVAYARGYGLADLERNVPITTASAFDIGSTSKQFTAATIALLVQDGKLSFGDDVRKYIPELPIYGAPITIDNLMHHTSGLRDYVGLVVLAGHSLEEATTDSQALALVVHQRHLNFPTGSRYEYSNTGYFLLSVIVQRVTGKPLADVERERIFEPLGMMETRVRNHFAMLIPNRALGYGPNGHGGFQNSMSNWEQTGDGAVQLSVDNALAWDKNFYHPHVGGQQMVDALQRRGTLLNGDTLTYARGLEVDHYRGLRRVQHGGDWIGYHAAFNRFPDQHTSIVILCNSDGIEPTTLADRVTNVVLAAKLGPPAAEVSAQASASGQATPATPPSLSPFVGSYFIASTNDVVRIADSANTLVLKAFGQTLPLTASGPSTFVASAFPVSTSFATDAAAPAPSLQLRIGSQVDERGVRFAPASPGADQLQAYVGRYYSPELDVTWPLVIKKGRLVLESPRSSLVDITGPLEPAMRDAFTAGSGFLRFTRDAEGHVTGFGLSASRMRDIRFDRQHAVATAGESAIAPIRATSPRDRSTTP